MQSEGEPNPEAEVIEKVESIKAAKGRIVEALESAGTDLESANDVALELREELWNTFYERCRDLDSTFWLNFLLWTISVELKIRFSDDEEVIKSEKDCFEEMCWEYDNLLGFEGWEEKVQAVVEKLDDDDKRRFRYILGEYN